MKDCPQKSVDHDGTPAVESDMYTIITALSAGFAAFFSFKAYIKLPVFMLILAIVARIKIRDALLSTIKIGVGFAGVFVIFTFFVTQITPTIQAIISVRGLNYPVADVGWPPLAAITWSSSLSLRAFSLLCISSRRNRDQSAVDDRTAPVRRGTGRTI